MVHGYAEYQIMHTNAPMLTTEKAAERLGVTTRRVIALIVTGRLPAIKAGRSWMIDERSLSRVKRSRPGRPSTRGAGHRRR